MLYVYQLVEQRSFLIAFGVQEEQAGVLNTKLTTLEVTRCWWWGTRAWSECELVAFLLPKTPQLGDTAV